VDFRRYYATSGWHAENLFKILDHALSCFFYRLIEKFFSEKAHRFLYSLVSRKIVCGGCGGEKMLKVLMDEQKQKPIFFSFIYAAPLVFRLQQDAKHFFAAKPLDTGIQFSVEWFAPSLLLHLYYEQTIQWMLCK
jgi:hypothetical protein